MRCGLQNLVRVQYIFAMSRGTKTNHSFNADLQCHNRSRNVVGAAFGSALYNMVVVLVPENRSEEGALTNMVQAPNVKVYFMHDFLLF